MLIINIYILRGILSGKIDENFSVGKIELISNFYRIYLYVLYQPLSKVIFDPANVFIAIRLEHFAPAYIFAVKIYRSKLVCKFIILVFIQSEKEYEFFLDLLNIFILRKTRQNDEHKKRDPFVYFIGE